MVHASGLEANSAFHTGDRRLPTAYDLIAHEVAFGAACASGVRSRQGIARITLRLARSVPRIIGTANCVVVDKDWEISHAFKTALSALDAKARGRPSGISSIT